MARRAKGALRLSLHVNEENDGTASGLAAAILHYLALGGELESGTSDRQIDRVYATSGTASTTETEIDLLDGSLTSPVGGTIEVADLVGLVVVNTGSSVNLYVAASDGVTETADAIVVPPGGWFAWSGGPGGIPESPGTGDVVVLSTPSSTTTYQLVVLGRSA